MALTIKASSVTTSKKEVYKRLTEVLGDRLKHNVDLAPFTTLGIGGIADLIYTAREPKELVLAIRTAQKLGFRFFVLGRGSNVLVSDSGFKGLVIRNRCQDLWVNKNSITCQSGVFLDDLVKISCEHGLSGLEFVAGIPGTVGAAIRGNAGAFGKSVSDVLTKAVILTDNGEIKEVNPGYFRFGYRESRLKKTGDVLLSATFKLKKQNKERIKRKIRGNLEKRKRSIPLKEKSAGCYFKNFITSQAKISAGFLLDQIGAKGMHEGDAMVSNCHANILINAGDAKAVDFRRLARKLKRKVKEKFDIELEEEVVYIY